MGKELWRQRLINNQHFESENLTRALAIDPSHSAVMLSLRRIKFFVFARQASHWSRVRPRLTVQKQSILFPLDSTWPPSEKGLFSDLREVTLLLALPPCQRAREACSQAITTDLLISNTLSKKENYKTGKDCFIPVLVNKHRWFSKPLTSWKALITYANFGKR